MEENFEDSIFKEISVHKHTTSNVIKAANSHIAGFAKISIEEDSHDGVKIVLKKDKNDNIKEIKFVCSCGQTKSVILDYNEIPPKTAE